VNPGRDAAWRPAVPPGHSPYTWGKLGQPAEARVGGKGKPNQKQKGKAPSSGAASAAAAAVSAAAAAAAPAAASAPAASASGKSAPPPPATGGTPVVLGRDRPSNDPILPIPGARNILVTSALPYVNNVPHLGNIIGSVLSADVYARFCRLRAHNVIYICGTDEYGTATETKALEEKLTPQEICDKYHQIHKGIYEWFNISFDKFGRTTTQQQTEIAQKIYLELERNGWSCEETVDQLYCEHDQRFLADRFVEGTCPDSTCAYEDARGDQCDKCGKLVNAIDLVNPRCKICGSPHGPPVKRASKHLFLDLQKLQPELSAWIETQKVKGEWSANAITITDAWLKMGLKPRCITRDLKWGTPVPKQGYEDKVFYVWYDAPIGYISITANYTPEWEKWWKNKDDVELVQFMGKDNIPFHCVMFPSTLMGADKDYTLLHHVSCTEYLQYEGAKFSKSRNTGVFGDNAKETSIPPEVWRYYLLYNRPEAADTTFLWEDFQNKLNTELLNNLGNFVNRTLKFLYAQCGNVVPAPAALLPSDHAFLAQVGALKADYIEHLEHVRIKDGLKVAMSLSKLANQFMQDSKPWELFKTDRARCDTVLFLSVNLISTLAVLLEPYMPSLTEKINAQLNQVMKPLGALDAKNDDTWNKTFTMPIQPGHILGTPSALFRKIEDEEVAAWRVKYGGKPAEKAKGEPFPLQLIMGQIVEAKDHEGAPHLMVLQLQTDEPAVVESESKSDKSENKPEKLLRPGFRQIVAGLRPAYEAQDLLGKYVAILANLKPSNFKGVRSEGMLLTAVKGKTAGLLTVAPEAAGQAAAAAAASAPSALRRGSLALPRDCVAAFKPNYDVKKELKKLDLMTRGKDGVVHFGSSPLQIELPNGEFVQIIGDKAGEGAKIQ